jgi:hypothetical protein
MKRITGLFQSFEGERMKRAKIYEFYKLGGLQLLTNLELEEEGELPDSDTSWGFVYMAYLLTNDFTNNPENAVLPGAIKVARELRNDCANLMREIQAKTPLRIGRITLLKATLSKFENLLEYDLSRFPTFSVERTGIFDSDDLVLNAHKHLSDASLKISDPKVIEDFKAAGRCLAFDLFTACGFHAVRALEAVARAYHKQLTGKDAQEDGTPLGGVANDLRDIADDKCGKPPKPRPKDDPLRLVVSNLDRMNNIYRKPLAHPEMVLKSREDAKNVFDLVAISIALISEQIVAPVPTNT